MSAMVARRISQETFDQTVTENMEEFEMEREEAIADAVSQFKTQGIDLSNIDTTGRADRREEQEQLSQAIRTLEREALAAAGRLDADASASPEARRTEMLAALATVAEACARQIGAQGHHLSRAPWVASGRAFRCGDHPRCLRRRRV